MNFSASPRASKERSFNFYIKSMVYKMSDFERALQDYMASNGSLARNMLAERDAFAESKARLLQGKEGLAENMAGTNFMKKLQADGEKTNADLGIGFSGESVVPAALKGASKLAKMRAANLNSRWKVVNAKRFLAQEGEEIPEELGAEPTGDFSQLRGTLNDAVDEATNAAKQAFNPIAENVSNLVERGGQAFGRAGRAIARVRAGAADSGEMLPEDIYFQTGEEPVAGTPADPVQMRPIGDIDPEVPSLPPANVGGTTAMDIGDPASLANRGGAIGGGQELREFNYFEKPDEPLPEAPEGLFGGRDTSMNLEDEFGDPTELSLQAPRKVFQRGNIKSTGFAEPERPNIQDRGELPRERFDIAEEGGEPVDDVSALRNQLNDAMERGQNVLKGWRQRQAAPEEEPEEEPEAGSGRAPRGTAERAQSDAQDRRIEQEREGEDPLDIKEEDIPDEMFRPEAPKINVEDIDPDIQPELTRAAQVQKSAEQAAERTQGQAEGAAEEAGEAVDDLAPELTAATSAWSTAAGVLGDVAGVAGFALSAYGLVSGIEDYVKASKMSFGDPYAALRPQLTAAQNKITGLENQVSADQFESKLGIAPPSYGSMAVPTYDTAKMFGGSGHF